MALFRKRLVPWKVQVIAFVIDVLLRLIAATWRLQFNNIDNYIELVRRKQPFILVFWHGEMLMGWFFHRGKRFASLVSQSKDGDVLSEVLRRWKYVVVRGSSSKGGKEAQETMEQLIRDGEVLVITPDGPRGPRYEMKMGAIRIAQKTGVPIVGVKFYPKKAYYLKSWDQFTIPYPFTSITVRYYEPEYVDPSLQKETLVAYREGFQKMMVESSH